VTARRQLEFTASRAVCRLTQVRRGRGAKRGKLRGAARTRAGRGGAPGGGPTKCLVGPPPVGGRLVRDTSVDHSGRLTGWVGCLCAAQGIQAPTPNAGAAGAEFAETLRMSFPKFFWLTALSEPVKISGLEIFIY
jgi:hypothetical protein